MRGFMTIVLSLLFCLVSLNAEHAFNYHLDITNAKPVVKEAVILTLELNQTETGKVVRFSFDLPKSQNYQTEFLEADESKDYKNRTRVVIKYAIFPLRADDIEIPLQIILQESSQEELKKFVTGSADELMYLQTTNHTYPLPSLKLHVRPLPHETQIVGDFQLTFKLKNNHTTADKQTNITYTLSGRGYRPEFKTLLPKIDGVTQFLDKEEFHNKLFHKINFHYALISDTNFTIPKINIAAYNPKENKVYRLSADPLPIVIDPVTTPNKSEKQFFPDLNREFLKELVDYILIFLAGFFTYIAIDLFAKKRFEQRSQKKEFLQKIKYTKTEKELMQILIAFQSSLFDKEIRQLEQSLYHNKKLSMQRLKKQIKQKFAEHQEHLRFS